MLINPPLGSGWCELKSQATDSRNNWDEEKCRTYEVFGCYDRWEVYSFPIISTFDREEVAGWKLAVISFAGRVTLLKTVLSAIPTYSFANGWIPNKVMAEIENIMRTFLWDKGKDE